jgi:hypothetical protein
MWRLAIIIALIISGCYRDYTGSSDRSLENGIYYYNYTDAECHHFAKKYIQISPFSETKYWLFYKIKKSDINIPIINNANRPSEKWDEYHVINMKVDNSNLPNQSLKGRM